MIKMRMLIGQLVILISGWCNISGSGTVNTGEGLFPEIKGWKLTVSERIYTPDDLWDFIDGAAGAYINYDFVDLNLADYQQDSTIIRVELYRHSTFDNAFGIYAYERNPGYDFTDIGTEGYTSEGILNFLAGCFYVKLSSAGTVRNPAVSMRMIAGELAGELSPASQWPRELKLFPEMNKIHRSEHYVTRNFLGFDFLGHAFTADYSDNDNFQLFIIHGGQQQDIRTMLRKYLSFTGQDIDPPDSETFLIKDPYNGDITAMIVKEYMLGLINCKDQVTGIKYLDMIRKDLTGE